MCKNVMCLCQACEGVEIRRENRIILEMYIIFLYRKCAEFGAFLAVFNEYAKLEVRGKHAHSRTDCANERARFIKIKLMRLTW